MRSNNCAETIIGFHVLSNDIFIKVHENLKIEILNGPSSEFIEIKTFPASFYNPIYRNYLKTLVAELPNQQIALAYCALFSTPSILVILDLKSLTCIAQTSIQHIKSLCVLPCETALLINSEWICSLKGNQLTVKKDQHFADFSLQHQTNREIYRNLSDTQGRYRPLPNGSGFIYYDHHHQSTLKLLSNRFEEKHELRLCHKNYDASQPGGRLFKVPSYRSTIKYFTFFSDHSFACVSEYLNKFTFRYASHENKTHYLHIIRNDLQQSYTIQLHHLVPKSLIALNNDYVGVLGYYYKNDYQNYREIGVKVYDSTGKKIKKVTLDKSVDRCFIVATSNGQLVTCSVAGKIVIHRILTINEKLRKKTHSVLEDIVPKVLIPIVTDYAGFSNDKRSMPKEKFAEITYPDADSKQTPKVR